MFLGHTEYNRKYSIMYNWYLDCSHRQYFYNFFFAFSSDSSMCSDIDLEKCDLEVITSFDLKDDSDSKSATSAGDTVDWSRCKDQLVLDLQVSNYARISSIVYLAHCYTTRTINVCCFGIVVKKCWLLMIVVGVGVGLFTCQ